MNKLNWTTIKTVSIMLGALGIAATANPAKAQDVETQIKSNQDLLNSMKQLKSGKTINGNLGSNGMSQITSVSELRDVAPTDWAYEALRSLVERYGCIVGYPDRTFRGNQSLSRWEFAAGLNACLNTMERLIQEGGVGSDDIAKLKKIVQEFQGELTALGARVDNLEQRVSFLEDHQFSTTTKLQGEVIFSISDAGGSNKNNSTVASSRKPTANTPNSFGNQVVFNDRVRLNFLTSFTGQDVLKVRLEAGNTGNPNLGTATGAPSTRLAYDSANTNNGFFIDNLYYRFPIGNLTTTITANKAALDDEWDTYSPYLASSGTGSLTRAERYNNIVYGLTNDGTGISLKYKFSNQIALSGAYLAKSTTPGNGQQSSDPSPGFGLFNGSYEAGAQLDFNVTKDFKFGVTYVHSYDGASTTNGAPNLFVVGSSIGNNPFNGAAVSADRYGLEATWNIIKGLNFSAWAGEASTQGHGSIPGSTSVSANGLSADIWSWNAALSFVDLGKEGAVLTIGGGLLPSALGISGLTTKTINALGVSTKTGGTAYDQSASYILQLQYAYPVTQNIQLTPGFYYIINSNGLSTNSDVYVGVLRTTFTF